MLKVQDWSTIYISKRQSDFAISRGFYYHETSFRENQKPRDNFWIYSIESKHVIVLQYGIIMFKNRFKGKKNVTSLRDCIFGHPSYCWPKLVKS